MEWSYNSVEDTGSISPGNHWIRSRQRVQVEMWLERLYQLE